MESLQASAVVLDPQDFAPLDITSEPDLPEPDMVSTARQERSRSAWANGDFNVYSVQGDNSEHGVCYRLAALCHQAFRKRNSPIPHGLPALTAAIRFTKLALATAPTGEDLDTIMCWLLLANLFRTQYHYLGNNGNIETLAARVLTVKLKDLVTQKPVSPRDPECTERLLVIGRLVHDAYCLVLNPARLDEITKCLISDVRLIPADNPLRPRAFRMAAACIWQRYKHPNSRSRNLADFVEAITHCETTVDLMPVEDPVLKGRYLYLLSEMMMWKRNLGGMRDDLDKFIHYIRRTADELPPSDDYRVSAMISLITALHDRYTRHKVDKDVQEALQWQRKLLQEATTESDYWHWAVAQGVKLTGTRAEMTKDLHLLEEAVALARNELAEIHGVSNAIYLQAELLDQLAYLLTTKFMWKKNIPDLEECVRIYRTLVQVWQYFQGKPHSTPETVSYVLGNALDSLSTSLSMLAIHTKDPKNVRDAAVYSQRYREMKAPVEFRHTPREALVEVMYLMHHIIGSYGPSDAQTLRDAFQRYTSVMRENNFYHGLEHTIPSVLLRYAIKAGLWEEAWECAKIAIDFVFHKSIRSLSTSDRIALFRDWAGLASQAAATAFQAGNSALEALLLLEKGRGIFGASLEQLRVDTLRLQGLKPELAERLAKLRGELEMATSLVDIPQALDSQNPLLQDVLRQLRVPEDDIQLRRKQEFDELLLKIQETPGFGDFLRSLTEEEIRDTADCGPIVVINVSKSPPRCDALLIEPGQIREVPLPNLTYESIKSRESEAGMYETLEWLWDAMARPILEALGYTKPMQPIVQDGDVRVPHIWWVPTGPLTVFPLHAAGLHKKNSGETVLDRVVSSYASSVRSLRHARGRPTSLEPSGPGASPGNDLKQRALLVAVENTPGLPSLMSAVEEIKNAKTAVESMGMQAFDKSSSCVKHDIAEQLRTCDWFHFAGHGYTAPDDASKSSLIFRAPDNPNNHDVDRQENSLTIAELLNMELAYRVGQPAPFLAYLSACGTGRMRDEQSRDESIHLASAFQLAGFRHVVGTLWNVQDAVCKEVASLTYQTIQSEWEKNKTWTDDSVALALHHALRVMRDKRIPQNGDDRGESGRDMQLVEEDEWADWAPFVHFGV